MKIFTIFISLALCSCKGYTGAYNVEYNGIKFSAVYTPTSGKEVVPVK